MNLFTRVTKSRLHLLLHLKFALVCSVAACTRPEPVQHKDPFTQFPPLEERLPLDPVAQAMATLAGFYNPWQLQPASLAADGFGGWHDTEIAHIRPGIDTLATRMSLLNFAQRSVRLQTFIMKGDETGQAFANKLIELVGRGVDVSLLVDDANVPFKGAESLYFYLTSNGVKVHGYRPLWMQIGNGTGRFTNLFRGQSGAVTDLFQFADRKNHRYHEKIMVVDAEISSRAVAMVGGTNLANEYYDIQVKSDELRWRDQDVVVRGDGIIADLVKAFDTNLADVTEFNKSSSFSDVVDGVVSGSQGLFGRDRALGLKLDPKAMQSVAAASTKTVSIEWSRSNARMIHHRPLRKEWFLEQALLGAIAKAQREVIFVNPYFIPSKAMVEGLVATAKRGVRVQILTNSKESCDSPTVQEVGRMFYRPLLADTDPTTRGGPQSVPIEIYEWGGETEFKNGFSNLHAKYAIFDRQVAFVGSFNLDPRSQVFNNEVMIETDDRLLVARLIEQFTHDSGSGFASLVTPQELAEFDASPDLDKMRVKVLSMFKVFL